MLFQYTVDWVESRKQKFTSDPPAGDPRTFCAVNDRQTLASSAIFKHLF